MVNFSLAGNHEIVMCDQEAQFVLELLPGYSRMWAFKLKEKKSPTDLGHHHRIHRDQKRTEPVNKRQHATFLQMLVYMWREWKKKDNYEETL